MPKKKIYAVRNGREIGLFRSWDECKASIERFKGAEYKSFETEAEALEYINSPDLTNPAKSTGKKKETLEECVRNIRSTLNDGESVAFVDGSYSDEEHDFGCAFVFIDKENYTAFYFRGDEFGDEKDELIEMRNVAGELKATVLAISHAILSRHSKIKIYHDYQGIASWVTGEWKTNKVGTKNYKKTMDAFSGAIDISFEKVKSHSGIPLNEEADKLAKKALGIV